MTQRWQPDWHDDGAQAVINGKNIQIDNQAETIRSLQTQVSKLRSMLETCHVAPEVIDQVLAED